jgi:ATP-dependent helicase HrpA
MKQGIPNVKSPLAALSAQLGELMLRDQQRLQRRLQGARKIKNPDAQLAVAAELESDITAALQKVQSRAASCPKVTYPETCRSARKNRIFCRPSATIRW